MSTTRFAAAAGGALRPDSQPALPGERVLVESYPYAAWKSLGLKPLPAKGRTRVIDLAEAYAALRSVVPLTTNRPPNHDQLQAIVGGLPGLALEEHNRRRSRLSANVRAARRATGARDSSFCRCPQLVPSGCAG